MCNFCFLRNIWYMTEPLYIFYVQSLCFYIIYYLVWAFMYLYNLIMSVNIKLFFISSLLFLMFLLVIFLSSGNIQCLIASFILYNFCKLITGLCIIIEDFILFFEGQQTFWLLQTGVKTLKSFLLND